MSTWRPECNILEISFSKGPVGSGFGIHILDKTGSGHGIKINDHKLGVGSRALHQCQLSLDELYRLEQFCMDAIIHLEALKVKALKEEGR